MKTVKGIDVASYQSSTFSTAGLAFVFVKATEGTSYTNPKMTAQAAHARKAGCVVGFYHFLRPGDMKRQAAYFVEQAASIEGDPLFADWEDSGVSCAAKDQFLAEVKRLRSATHRVGLYCNRDFWVNHDTTSQAGDGLWIADYVGAGKPRIKAEWLFHQYTDSPVDTNLGAFADKAALRAWADVAEPPKKPAPPKTPPAPPKAPSKVPPFPGAGHFRIGHSDPAVTALDKQLVRHGFTRHNDGNGYQPGPIFTEFTRENVRDFQRSRPELAGDADGYPGPQTWTLLHR